MMKRVYEVKIERGNRYQAGQYIVVAASDEEAVRKAKAQARAEHCVRGGWRCVELHERSTQLVG